MKKKNPVQDNNKCHMVILDKTVVMLVVVVKMVLNPALTERKILILNS